MEMKVTGLGPMVSNYKRSQVSSWTVPLAEEDKGKVVPVLN
jgi:hypothetical protein